MSSSVGAVVVTGCSSGIGQATAALLARRGHTVYATARQRQSLAALEAAGCRTLSLDVTDEDSMRAAVDTVVSEAGAVGALVNNAGYSQSGALETLALDDVRRQFETNVFGLLRMCQLVLPSMRQQGRGRIVNVSSMGANFTFPGGGSYHATKYAVEALSDALRFEVAGFGVGVSIVQPGIIRTSFSERAVAEVPKPAAEAGPYDDFNASVARATQTVYEQGALARLGGDAEDVAKVIARAITARRAPIRVRVTPSAHYLVNQRRLMPDRVWDRFLRTQFPTPAVASVPPQPAPAAES
ncbi:MAG TPA: SDR family NAD(P)-dependent oxidoreductase [Jatrophihabitans sp.]|jgi:NAD(P)-dependent dehydrogenase (short-subunit alcohol dehydrogenase family)|uniref:SDR family NAD(P)-dependent oxidoreductase n=1 Tax=Jatrophihabitans sp. TaxID=1932789 RepID=UPI002EE0E5F0